MLKRLIGKRHSRRASGRHRVVDRSELQIRSLFDDPALQAVMGLEDRPSIPIHLIPQDGQFVTQLRQASAEATSASLRELSSSPLSLPALASTLAATV